MVEMDTVELNQRIEKERLIAVLMAEHEQMKQGLDDLKTIPQEVALIKQSQANLQYSVGELRGFLVKAFWGLMGVFLSMSGAVAWFVFSKVANG